VVSRVIPRPQLDADVQMCTGAYNTYVRPRPRGTVVHLLEAIFRDELHPLAQPGGEDDSDHCDEVGDRADLDRTRHRILV
jgi:hypothetical protein